MSLFRIHRISHPFAALVLCLSFTLDTHAETSEFTARLAPMPVDFRSASKITGLGELRAKLEGSRLELRGEFSGLSGTATLAQVRQGPLAIPGPAIAELQVSPAADGTISGSIDLNSEQIEHLNGRALYIQIHSQAAPDGNLRGWLLAAPTND